MLSLIVYGIPGARHTMRRAVLVGDDPLRGVAGKWLAGAASYPTWRADGRHSQLSGDHMIRWTCLIQSPLAADVDQQEDSDFMLDMISYHVRSTRIATQ
jgi:hypothetical protein